VRGGGEWDGCDFARVWGLGVGRKSPPLMGLEITWRFDLRSTHLRVKPTVAWVPQSSLFTKYHFKVSKNLKLNLHIDNVVIYNHGNFQVEIPYIWSCAKMTKSNPIIVNSANFQNLKICHIFSFLCSPKY
jgi:hypothetical protein